MPGVYFPLTCSNMSGCIFVNPSHTVFQFLCSQLSQIKGEGFGAIFSGNEALQKYTCKGPSKSSSISFLQLELLGTR